MDKCELYNCSSCCSKPIEHGLCSECKENCDCVCDQCEGLECLGNDNFSWREE